MASREGIEPSTRRLRVTGGPSGGVRPCRFPLMLLGLASASVRSVRFDSTGWGFTLGFNFYSRRWPRSRSEPAHLLKHSCDLLSRERRASLFKH